MFKYDTAMLQETVWVTLDGQHVFASRRNECGRRPAWNRRDHFPNIAIVRAQTLLAPLFDGGLL